MEISTETLNLMLLLVPGFIAFRIYKIDADWSAISPMDVGYGSLIFSVGGYAILDALRGLVDLPPCLVPYGNAIHIFSALLIASSLGLTWRKWGHGLFHTTLQRLKITNEDNQGDVWQYLFNQPKTHVRQIYAYLKDGYAIGCNDTALFHRDSLRRRRIYPFYTHSDRQICFAANIHRVNGEWVEIPDVDGGDERGLLIVYFNPDELQRIEVRISPDLQPANKTAWREYFSRPKASVTVVGAAAEEEGPSPSEGA